VRLIALLKATGPTDPLFLKLEGATVEFKGKTRRKGGGDCVFVANKLYGNFFSNYPDRRFLVC
jgi:hypothetical protein